MKTKLTTIFFLILPLTVNSQTWKVFGIDPISLECKTYSQITFFNDVLWTGMSKLDSTTITAMDSPSLLFACDISMSDHKGNLWFVGSIRPDVWTTHGNAYTVYKYDGSNWFDNSPPKSFGYNNCNSITFENEGKIWFTTSDSGAYMFNGTIWQHYSKQSVFDGAFSMAIDDTGNKWFATQNGLVKFDGNNWTVFNTSNSGLKFNMVNDIVIDKNDNIWLATGSPDVPGDTITGRIAKFDKANWIYYKAFNDSQGLNYVNTIAIDSFGKIWAGTFMGLTVFDGYRWKNYKVPDDPDNLQILSIDFDSDGNTWLGTTCGILEFLDNTVSLIHSPANNKISISPNPAKSEININLDSQNGNSEISIFDINGSVILKKNISKNNIQLDISHFKPGTYFIYINKASFKSIKQFIKE
jgi:streptogramin lyase